ncbi:MAG: phosphoglycerate dehydrogenase, partial [Thermoprotei archaeon]
MAKWKVVILSGTYGLHVPKAIEMIREVAEVTRGKIPKDITPEKMAEAIGDADIVVLGASGRIDEEVMKRVPKLKMIAKRGVGLDNIDLKAATKAGILVTYTKHANSQSVAEHTIGLILTLTKNITIANEEVRTKGWKIRSKLIGIELSGKTLGIIGFGFIGRKVAEIAKALGMNVLVYDPYVPVDVVRGFGCRVVDLDTLLRESDVVSIHAALTKETYHMI